MKYKIQMKKILCTVLAAIVLTSSSGFPDVKAEEADLEESRSWDGETMQTVYETDNCRITFSLGSYWEGAYNARIKIENRSDAVIDDWRLKFDFTHDITNIWNGEIENTQSGYITVKNAGWNQDIIPGASVEFGFTVGSNFEGFPQNYEILSTRAYAAENKYEIKYSVESNWTAGFNGKLTIKNPSEKKISDWQLTFDFDNEISSIWDAVILSHEGSTYTIKNAGYNPNIDPGAEISIGFIVSSGNSANEISNVLLEEIDNAHSSLEEDIKEPEKHEETDENPELAPPELTIFTDRFTNLSDDIYLVDEKVDILIGSISDISGVNELRYTISDINGQVIKAGTVSVAESWSVSPFGLVIGINYFSMTAIMSDESEHSKECIFFNQEPKNMNYVDIDMGDDDNDGINNYLEDYFGTNPVNPDTDGDGLEDIEELILYGTNPLLYDTDGNGISDGDEDADNDGLTNLQEVTLGTDPFLADTDSDGLCDGEEVNQYGTDPCNADTDGDALSDYNDLRLGFDPLKPDTDENGIIDSEEILEQTYTLKITNESIPVITTVDVSLPCVGMIDDSVAIKDVFGSDILSSNVVGLVGIPVEIHSDVPFDKAVITFHYDDSLLGQTKESDLCMMWYDAENDIYVLLEDCVIDAEQNTVSYTTTHFSTYLVVDKTQWLKAVQDNERKYKHVIAQQEKSVVLPESGTVYKCFETGMTWDEAKAYCENLGGHLATITSEGEQKIIESLMTHEGTKNNYWLGAERDSKNSFSKWITGEPIFYAHYKDGRPDNYMGVENALMIYRNDNPEIRGVCYGYWNDINKSGECNNEPFFGIENMGFICEWNNVPLKDSDGDGVLDIYEEGYILSNGRVITSNPIDKDTDKDGKSDYEEMGGEPEIIQIVTKEKEYLILRWRMVSDPNAADSDGDGVNDDKDANPLVKAPNSEFYELTDNKITDDIEMITNYKIAREAERTERYGTGQFTETELQQLQELYYKASLVVSFTKLSVEPTSKALAHYLDNTGDDLYLDSYIREAVTANEFGRKFFDQQIDRLFDYSENILKDGDTLTVMCRSNFFTNKKDFRLSIDFPADIKWFATLGTSSGLIIANVSRQGVFYSMSYRYIIFDYYDWSTTDIGLEFISGLPDYEMSKLESCGLAKSYFLMGQLYEYSYDINY